MKIEKEKYMNTALVILQGLLASGKYNEVDFEKKAQVGITIQYVMLLE